MSKKIVKSNKHNDSKKGIKPTKKKYKNKLDEILSLEKKLLKEEEKIAVEEKRIRQEESIEREKENKIEKILEKEESDLEKIEKIEQEIKAEIGGHPLAQVTYKDIVKGLIGAFIGLAIHYTFVYGVKVSETLTMTRAIIMFPLTFLVGLLFIYATGFRKVEDKKLLVYMPLRLSVLYLCALIMSILVLFLFYPTFGHEFEESFKMVAGVMLAAVVGACTADLLGKE
jgi:uncharacterized membrane protein